MVSSYDTLWKIFFKRFFYSNGLLFALKKMAQFTVNK
jgi:hypothetical protein